MKKAKTIVAGLIAAAFFLFCAAAYPEPTEQFYANDYAEVLSNETESYIVSQSSSLAERTGAQIVVLTVKHLMVSRLHSMPSTPDVSGGLEIRRKTTGFCCCSAQTKGKSILRLAAVWKGR